MELNICALRSTYGSQIGVLTYSEVIDAESAYSDFCAGRQALANGPQSFIDKMFRSKWENRFMESVERACETVSLFMIKHRHELKLSPKMSEREWMHFDNIFKQLIYDLLLITTINCLFCEILPHWSNLMWLC